MSNSPLTPQDQSKVKPNIGLLGETLVAEWLQQQGWAILHRRWRCRWGEIDLIAQQTTPGEKPIEQLVFVEVKTRRLKNWDAGGLLAIDQQKQTKILKAAQMFLGERPARADLPCRFDVALVSCQSLPTQQPKHLSPTQQSHADVPPRYLPIRLGQPCVVLNYQLTLVNYIESAWT